MAAMNGRIAGLGAHAASPASAAPVVIKFAEAGKAPLKIGETISGCVEAHASSYRLSFAHHGATYVQNLRGGGISPGSAAFTVVSAHANGIFLQGRSADEARLSDKIAPQQAEEMAGAPPLQPGHEGTWSRAELRALTKSGPQNQRSRAAGSAAIQRNLLHLRQEAGAVLAAQQSEGLPAVGALLTSVNNVAALANSQLYPTFANRASAGEAMSGIDLQSLAPRAGPVITDFSTVRIDIAQANDLGLKGGEVVQGVVERDGEGMRFSFDLSGQSVSIPLPGKELPVGKTVLTLAVADPGHGWLRPGSITPAPADSGATQYINESMTAASLLLRPQNTEALAVFLAPANLNRLIANPEIAEYLLPLLKTRLKTDRFGPLDVKSVFESCGIWAEGLLAQSRQLRKSDVKSALLGVLNASRERLADLTTLDQFSGALGAIESAQVQAVQAQSNGELLFNFFIPFADANPVRVSVSRSAPAEFHAAPPLVVNLYTKNDLLGEVWLRTQIEKNADIEIVMWAVESRVVSAASTASRRLLENFREFGLQLKKISIINGARPESENQVAAAGQLVNVKI